MTEYKSNILEIDDPTNRIGTLIYSEPAIGEIRQNAADFYVWPVGARRGYRTISYDSACEWLKLEKGLGWADYRKTQKLGRMIERNKVGEIWKHENSYYVWIGEGCCVEHYLSRARAWIEIKERA